MTKLVTISMLLVSLSFSTPLPKSNELTDWEKVNYTIKKKECLMIRLKIFKGFNKGVSLKPKNVKLWNVHCEDLTGYHLYTPKRCDAMFKDLMSFDFNFVNRTAWNQIAKKWNKDCGPIQHKKIMPI